MAMPTDVPIIDLMVGFPASDRQEVYKFLKPHLRDEESQTFKMPAEYLFKDVPAEIDDAVDPVAVTLGEMTRHGVAQGMINIASEQREAPRRALAEHPDRFIPCCEIDPNTGMEGVRKIVELHQDFGVKAVTTTPFAYRVPINDARYYPIYAKCVELDIPVFMTVGVPGPRVPMAPQKVELLDEVCWFFPELRIVMRHGAEPWQALAVKLMLKWPNLFYSTSAFAPKHYPREIIEYANTRGASKVLYAGYFPAGLTYDRIMGELPEVPFNDDVWPSFLAENARRVLKLDQP